MTEYRGWIGVDLDATLANYHKWTAPDDIGAPVPAMVARVRQWLADGEDVRIFTARGSVDELDRSIAYPAIQRWCLEHLGRVLPITNVKDIHMRVLYDDRAVRVEKNTGRLIDEDREAHPDLVDIVREYSERNTIALVYGINIQEMTREELLACVRMFMDRTKSCPVGCT